MKKITALTGAFLLTPMLAFAQFGEVDTFLGNIGVFINNVLIPLLFAIALFFFLLGVFKFVIQGSDPEERSKGQSYMIWAIIGFVIMVSVFGIVNLIADGLGFSDKPLENLPDVPTSNS